ncbi:uncharacterized protein LOC114356747 [Ostrinia furnacalis]|nr:uncharacterized protein LOC114356747 [Ostrinia furnacalis]
MKSVIFFIGIVGFVVYSSTRAQLFEDPSKTFQNMTFDMVNRGSYNATECVVDMLNCWEAVKPDKICTYWYWYASICSIMREFCAEWLGDQDNFYKKFSITQGMCLYNSEQMWS